MKGKKYSTEDKIRILRQADGGRSILEVCREANISEVTFHRWKNQFGQMEISEAKRLKELERENTELKKMLAESLLKNRVLEAVCEKSYKPGAATASRSGGGGQRAVFRAGGVPVFEGIEVDVLVSEQRANEPGAEAAQADEGAQRKAWPLRVSANRRPAAAGGLAGRKKTRAAVAKIPRAASAAHQAQGGASWRLHGAADEGRAPGPCLELGLHLGCHHARRSPAHADDSG